MFKEFGELLYYGEERTWLELGEVLAAAPSATLDFSLVLPCHVLQNFPIDHP
jgi:hypothetical protein